MNKVLLLTIALNIASVYTSHILPYEVRKMTYKTLSLLKNTPKFTGGLEAKDGQFPFMIFMGAFYGDVIKKCSGSLFRKSRVLLAAHCLEDKNIRSWNVFLVGGKANVEEYVKARIKLPLDIPVNEEALGLEERRASGLYKHPKYDKYTVVNDVAVIFLNRPFTSPNITTISLSPAKMMRQMRCTIIGWGLSPLDSENFKLHYVPNELVTQTELGCRFKREGPFICLKTYEFGICGGDSGGPLVCYGRIWGVASHYTHTKRRICGESLEDYYSEVFPVLQWLYDPTSGTAVVSFDTVLVLTGFWILFFINSCMYEI